MKLAIISNTINATTETFIARHIRHLNGGNNVVILLRGGNNNKIQNNILQLNTKNWYKLPGILRTIFSLKSLILYGTPGLPGFRTYDVVCDFLIREKVDVILAEYGPLGSFIYPVANKLNLPLFCYFRGKDASKKLKKRKIQFMYRRTIPKMNGIFAVSPHLLDNLNTYGIKNNNQYVFPSGTETDQFVPGLKSPHSFVSVGRFVNKKSPHTTIRVFSEIVKEFPNVKLTMIGDGPLLQSSIEMANSLGVLDNINFRGACNNQEVQKCMKNATYFLLHSVTSKKGDTEGFPSAIQEAMASGCVVVSTIHGGIPQFIESGKNGFLVEEHDEKNYVYILKKLLNNNKLVEKVAVNSRRTAEKKFNIDVIYPKIEKILRRSI